MKVRRSLLENGFVTKLNGPVGSSGSLKLHFINVLKIRALAGLPQVIIILHGKPTLWGAPQRLRKPQSHLGADATYSLNHTVQGRGRYTQLRGQKSRADPERFQVYGSDEFTRGGDYA